MCSCLPRVMTLMARNSRMRTTCSCDGICSEPTVFWNLDHPRRAVTLSEPAAGSRDAVCMLRSTGMLTFLAGVTRAAKEAAMARQE
jgi:hypothetical protein